MPKFVVKDGNVSVTVDGHDISDDVREVDVDRSRSAKDVSGLGSKFEEKLAGLGAGVISMQVYNDGESGSTNSIFDALADSDTPVTVVVTIPVKTYTMADSLLTDWHPLNGQAGEASVSPAVFVNAGNTGIVQTS